MSFTDLNIPNGDYIFFPIEEDDTCRAIHSLINVEDGKSDILIQNRTQGPASITRNSPMGFLYNFVSEEDDIMDNSQKAKPKPNWLEKLHLFAPQEHKTRYRMLFQKFCDIFSHDEFDLGWTDTVKHSIPLKYNNPIFTKQFHIAFFSSNVINDFVDDMLNKGLTESNHSKYNSPIFCIQKKNGSWRPVIDLRKINASTIADNYSIKDVRSCLDSISSAHAKIFTSIDLKSGFLQQSLDINSRKYTAFTIPGRGQFQLKVSCFGSRGAPSSFSKLMDYVPSGLPNTISYINDILIFSRTHEEHITCLIAFDD